MPGGGLWYAVSAPSPADTNTKEFLRKKEEGGASGLGIAGNAKRCYDLRQTCVEVTLQLLGLLACEAHEVVVHDPADCTPR